MGLEIKGWVLRGYNDKSFYNYLYLLLESPGQLGSILIFDFINPK